jgi:unsaturated chondroitin disaccharide hydrolase
MWQLYNRTLDKFWRLNATSYTTGIAAAKTAGDDLGFRFNPTYRNLYAAMQDPSQRQVLIDAATSKVATWNAKVGMFKSVDFRPSTSGNPQANFPVLIDHNMDLELVYWAAKQTGNQSWIDKANAHLAKVVQTFIRPDGGTIQWGYFFDQTGAFVSGETRQGLSNTSTWSRGQTWLIYTLTNAYAETGRADFLAAAKKVANYYLAHLPGDSIPYWDFNAPVTATTPRDTSAGAVAASALLKLASLIPTDPDSATYRAASYATIASLISPTYLTEGTGSRGILAHGAKYIAQGISDNSLIYGDYYLLEALNRYSVL